MRHLRNLLVVAAVLMVAGSASAFNYHYDIFGDGSSPFDRNNNSSGWLPNATDPYYYPKVGALPSPGYLGEGGEGFDLEGIKVKEDDQFLYVAVANSFGFQAYSPTWNQYYQLGDLFIGVDGQKNKFAIDFFNVASTGNASLKLIDNNVNYMSAIQNIGGSYYGNSTIRNAAGAFQVKNGGLANLGSVEFSKSYMAGYETDYINKGAANGNTYVWEFKLDKNLLGDFTTLDFHMTLGCGNDFMNESYTAVPEPGTAILFGLGLAGAAVVRRMRRRPA